MYLKAADRERENKWRNGLSDVLVTKKTKVKGHNLFKLQCTLQT